MNNWAIYGTLIVVTVTVGTKSWAQQIDFRTINGKNNNVTHVDMGEANSQLERVLPSKYSDSLNQININLPNARLISNLLLVQTEPEYDSVRNDLFWNFGQFIDHDLVLNRGNSGELILVNVPKGDSYFDPYSTGTAKIPVVRGAYDPATSDTIPREQINQVTSWLDGSNIYGSNLKTIDWLRTHNLGKLKQSNGKSLPFNTLNGEYDGEIDYSAPFMENPVVPQSKKIFVAGDIRANEQPGLLSIHTLFVREHNRICDVLSERYPSWDDEKYFQIARKYVNAEIQVITYNEWLPLLGVDIAQYEGYDSNKKVAILNEFSAVAFRFGHSLVNEQFVRLDNEGQEILYGSVNLQEAFFNPNIIKDEGGIEPFIRGMSVQHQQRFDPQINNSIRNFLFGEPGNGGLDLGVLNIMRGRERGISDFNSLRQALGLNRYTNFLDVSPEYGEKLEMLYQNINTIDPWVGVLCENSYNHALVGETAYNLIKRQFEELRDGDRFWFENDPYFSQAEKDSLSTVRLSDVIKLNTNIKSIQKEAFKAKNPYVILSVEPFEHVSKLDIKLFPNPFFERLTLEIKVDLDMKGFVQITSLEGKMIYLEEVTLTKGQNLIYLDLSNSIRTGPYILDFYTDNAKGRYKIMKK